MTRNVVHINLGKVDYERVWILQKRLVDIVYANRKSSTSHATRLTCDTLPSNQDISSSPGNDFTASNVDYLITCQHPSVYTLGKGGLMSNLKENIQDRRVVRVERGGDVTWHGEGQFIAYPILDLHAYKKDLHWYVRSLEESVISTISLYNIIGQRSKINSGVWVGPNKISAVGIAATRWITMHGIAINVDCNMSNFDRIIPCGIREPGTGVCSISQVYRPNYNETTSVLDAQSCKTFVSVDSVKHLWLEAFKRQFNVNIIPRKHAAQCLTIVATDKDDEEFMEILTTTDNDSIEKYRLENVSKLS